MKNRITRLILLALLGLVAVGATSLLALRAWRQHVTANAIAIRSAKGIDEAAHVRIGGIDQWIEIRGEDRDNPVLLCLHGGPGATWTPLTPLFLSWEKTFTVVQWDQRGAGKTLESTGPSVAATMSIDRMTRDGIEVSEYLRGHLHKDKIFLLGHSFGSILGVNMVQRRPDLFHAYIGTGQVSNMPGSQQMSYDHMLEKARATADVRTLEALEQLGPPPFATMQKVTAYFRLLASYAPGSDRDAEAMLGRLLSGAPNYSLWDIYNRLRGFARVPSWELYHAMLSTDLSASAVRFEIPVFFIEGTEDTVTPASLAKEYFDKIDAPRKEFVALEGGGHFAVWSMSKRFGEELATRVRPVSSSAN